MESMAMRSILIMDLGVRMLLMVVGGMRWIRDIRRRMGMGVGLLVLGGVRVGLLLMELRLMGSRMGGERDMRLGLCRNKGWSWME